MTEDNGYRLPVQQNNNHAVGDIIAGNKNETTNVNQFGIPAPSTHLPQLLDRYRPELKNDMCAGEKC